MFMGEPGMLKSFIVENNNYTIEYLEKEGFPMDYKIKEKNAQKPFLGFRHAQNLAVKGF